MTRRLATLLAVAAAMAMITGCKSTPETPEEKQVLHDQAQAMLAEMKRKDPTLGPLLDSSYGYAIFPEVGEGAFILGGSYGHGEVYETGRFIGHADISGASVGLQAGGAQFAELLIFQNNQAMQQFKKGGFSFEAGASAVALKAGASAETNFRNGVAALTLPKGGLMASAAIGGQRFTFTPIGQEQ